MGKFNSSRFLSPDTVLEGPVSTRAKKGMELVNLSDLGIIPGVMGGAQSHGFHVNADIVTQTADGRDLNHIWEEFMQMLNAANESRQALIRFLTFPVVNETEDVAQPGDGVDFEPSSEFGEPVGSRVNPTYFSLGYTFKWYDLSARYTWQYLADAPENRVTSVANASVEAYYRLQLREVFRCLFNPTNLTASIHGNSYNVYKLYNADGTIPPTYKTNTFDGTHTHFKTTGEATLEANDLDVLVIDDFASHGYSMENGYQLMVLVHRTQGDVIRTFRAGAGTPAARYDFIPAQGQPGQLITLNQQILGAGAVPNTFEGLTVIGSYGPMLIIQDDWVPSTHVVALASGGSESLNNPIGLREHKNPGLRGLRLVRGKQPNYPLIDSFWNTGFGTGVRQRGGGIILEVTADASYDPPALYA